MMSKSAKAAQVTLMTNVILGHHFGTLLNLNNTTLRPYLIFKVGTEHQTIRATIAGTNCFVPVLFCSAKTAFNIWQFLTCMHLI